MRILPGMVVTMTTLAAVLSFANLARSAPQSKPVTRSSSTKPIAAQAPNADAIYAESIRRVTDKFDKFGLWNNGIYGKIDLGADADPKDVIAQAIRNVSELKSYQILNIQPVTIESLRQPAQAAVLQTNVGLKVLIFYSFKDAKGWWSRFYDATLTPSTRPTPPVP